MTIMCALIFCQYEEIPSINRMICPCAAFVSIHQKCKAR
jgi:hypothetical protein